MLEQMCWKCGRSIPVDQFEGQTRRFCEKCYQEYSEELKPITTQYAILKNRIMFERAMRLMEKACTDMTRYKKYATAVMKHSRDNPELYRSADEMVAAVILLEDGHDIRMNYSVGSYLVDVLIPDMYVCLEIDGDRHRYSHAADGKRDVAIRSILGKKWEVIRVPTKYLESNPSKLPEAIKALYENIKTLREKNNGLLPEIYSKREREYYAQNTLMVTKKQRAI